MFTQDCLVKQIFDDIIEGYYDDKIPTRSMNDRTMLPSGHQASQSLMTTPPLRYKPIA